MFNPGLNENIEELFFTPITTGVKKVINFFCKLFLMLQEDDLKTFEI